MSNISYPDLPNCEDISSDFKAIAKEMKVTNLLLSFLDFHTTEEVFSDLKKSNFKNANLVETINDLKHYGYNISMPETAAEYRSEIFPLIMEMHAKAGYYGVQIPVGGVYFDAEGMLTEESISLLKQQKEIVEKAGLVASAVGGYWVEDWQQCIKPHIQAANVLGSKFLYGPFSTPFLYFPEGASSGEASMEWVDGQIDRFSQLLQQEIGPFAAQYDVTICEEPLQRFERMPIRLREAVKLAQKANIANFKVMIDMCHECADGDGPAKFAEHVNNLVKGGHFHGVHISALHRGKLYESWFNQEYFNDFFRPILASGYKGEICIETFDATEPVVEAAKVNRRKFTNPVGVMINQLVYSADKLSKLQ